MARITQTLKTFFFITMLFCSLSIMAQRSIIELSISEQVIMADQAVEAKVLNSESFYNPTKEHIFTKHTLKVYKVFKGQEYTLIDIIVPGGIIGLKAEKVSHSLHLRKGDTGIFILKNLNGDEKILNTPDQLSFKSVGGDQSYFKYDISSNRVANPYFHIDDITANLYPEVILSSNLDQPIIVSEFAELSQMLDNDISLTLENETTISFNAIEYSAGTESILTIYGEGFGSEKGTISFSNSDYGGYLNTEVLSSQIISWTDNEINVEIPEFAGNGKIIVKTIDNVSFESDQNININYAQTNLEYDLGTGSEAFNTQHIGENGEGGYTFTMNGSFAKSEGAQSFKRAVENWSCNSGIKWEIDTQTTNEDKDIEDGLNLVTFDENNQLPGGTLAICRSRYQGCYEDGKLNWYVTEMDITVNDRSDWHFDESEPSNSSIDLESVALHELGHGHQLNHVIDTDKVMHYSFAGGDMKRELSVFDKEGAIDVQARSSSTPVCGQLTTSTVACSTLGTDEFTLQNTISLFPNPAKTRVNLSNASSANIEGVELYNLQGVKVSTFKFSNTHQREFNVSTLANGIYMVNIQTDLGNIVEKLIVK